MQDGRSCSRLALYNSANKLKEEMMCESKRLLCHFIKICYYGLVSPIKRFMNSTLWCSKTEAYVDVRLFQIIVIMKLNIFHKPLSFIIVQALVYYVYCRDFHCRYSMIPGHLFILNEDILYLHSKIATSSMMSEGVNSAFS